MATGTALVIRIELLLLVISLGNAGCSTGPSSTGKTGATFIPAAGQQRPANDVQADRMEKAFKEWVSKHLVENASLVVVRDGAIVRTVSSGSATPVRAVGVASLSKAITGVCIVKLVEAHKLQFDARLDTVLAGRFTSHPPKDERARNITIRQLLTHTSGITNDPSQGIAFNQFRPFDKPSMDRQLDVALAVPLGNRPGSRYVYNNMNYAALAVIIETVTGEAYGDYCGREVLEAVGVNDATLKWEWASRGAYGGWKISPEGYAQFLDYFDPSKKLLSTPPADWPNVGGPKPVSWPPPRPCRQPSGRIPRVAGL